jgi:AAA domain
MAMLADLSTSQTLKLLVYGDSGTGKTCFAAGFPTPIEIHDFDGKANSAAYFFKNDADRLSKIDVRQYSKLPKERRIAEWERRLVEIAQMANMNQPLPFKTLVIDSLTTLVSSILDDYIYRSQTGIKRPVVGMNSQQDYGLLDKHMQQILSALLALDANVVFVGHITTEKDELTGSLSKKPFMAGKFADKLPMYFEEVYVSKVSNDGKYILQTQSDSYHKCRTQRGLPKEIPAQFSSLSIR